MRRRRVAIVIAYVSGVILATLDFGHLRGYVHELVPRQYAYLLPIATVAAFTIALYLSNAKYPHLVLDGMFVPTGAQGGHRNGLFVSNVGDIAALNVVIEPLGGSTFTVSFDPVPVVKVGGDREQVPMRYGSSVRDIFDVGTFLQNRHMIESGPGQEVEPISHPIRFTYEDAHGRRYVNEAYEIGFVNVTSAAVIDSRLIVRKRPAK